jgi:hypothetical protein
MSFVFHECIDVTAFYSRHRKYHDMNAFCVRAYHFRVESLSQYAMRYET